MSTIRLNRFPGLDFSSDKDMKELGRGSFEEKRHVKDNVEVRGIKWFDNKGVALVSSFESAMPLTVAKRYDRKNHEQVEVQCPRAVVTYNKFMGGVDLLDGLIAYYRIKIKSKKFYMKFIFHFLDMSIVNAWLLYRRACATHNLPKKLIDDLLSFKCSVFEVLLKQGKDSKRKRGRPSTDQVELEFEEKKKRGPAKPIPDFNIRRDGVGHWPVVTEERKRCRKPGCTGITVMKCNKCDLHLCLTKNRNCYASFHT